MEAALCFYKALKVYPQPSDLITIYDKTVPKVSRTLIIHKHKLTPNSACLGRPRRDDRFRPKPPRRTIRRTGFRCWKRWCPRCWIGLNGGGEGAVEGAEISPRISKAEKLRKFALSVRVVAGQATGWIGVDACTKTLPGAFLAVSYLVSNYKLRVRQKEDESSAV